MDNGYAVNSAVSYHSIIHYPLLKVESESDLNAET